MREPAQPIVGRARSLLDQLLRIAQTRLEMVSAEVQQEKLALLRQSQLAVAAIICTCLAGVTLITLLAVAVPPHLRTMVLSIVLASFILGAIGCALALRSRAQRPPLFSRVIQQIRLDRASLNDREQPGERERLGSSEQDAA
jgi:uncharacterized membrane protein YqjE